ADQRRRCVLSLRAREAGEPARLETPPVFSTLHVRACRSGSGGRRAVPVASGRGRSGSLWRRTRQSAGSLHPRTEAAHRPDQDCGRAAPGRPETRRPRSHHQRPVRGLRGHFRRPAERRRTRAGAVTVAWAATGRDRQYRRHCQNRAVKWGTFPATASLKENRPMTSTLSEDRYFEPARRDLARRLYDTVKHLPLICPHGHVDPAMLAAPHYDYGSPVDLLIIPDHYIFRMLYSHGIALEA